VEEKTNPARFFPKREIVLTCLAILVTLAASCMTGFELAGVFFELLRDSRWLAAVGHVIFLIIIAFLIYGGLVYLFTRWAYLKRRLSHRPAPRDVLEAIYDGPAPALTALIPSYKEEERVVFQALISVALQDYPHRRVVLLIDDPPHPGSTADRAQLTASRALPERVRQLLEKPADRFDGALADFLRRRGQGRIEPRKEAAQLAMLYREASAWFEEQAGLQTISDHADALFVEKVLHRHRDAHAARAADLHQSSQDRRVGALSESRLLREYRRLAAMFSVEVTSFERKRFVNLSHEPNKAMNLNSYIGLMGKSFGERLEGRIRHLEEIDPADADFSVPEADYIITLDADSLVSPDYALRLVHLMEQPGNERLAVAQTPYSAVPNPPGVLERIAGATTDIQYIIHQGFTRYDATYWVGANALLRTSALTDIAVTEEERGFPVTRYIQDRTVIEDTESSIDLLDRGLRLHNYPERLSYSATPPDFGSLIIQRRRWANGGLIILPKLLRSLARGPKNRSAIGEAFMRIHYLVSITAVNFGLVILLAFPFTDSIRSLWLPLTALPYFLLYMRDLVLIGYPRGDLLRVYALNLLLIPVNLAGVFKSLQQAWTQEKIPFGRTPKVQGRTAAAPLYILAEYVLLLHWSVGAGVDFLGGRWVHGICALGNAIFLFYAILSFVGLKESKEDLLAGVLWRRPRYGVQKGMSLTGSRVSAGATVPAHSPQKRAR
jgi:cellulose synthase/poly-beta-1,6-N-acetylglucosamine synthase-like glycosyltransferase